jgi:3-deoxy-D-arabino-heptulosonate 7-phosphate (DAHP) synthase
MSTTANSPAPATVPVGPARLGPGTLTVLARLTPGDREATLAAARAAKAAGAIALLVPAGEDYRSLLRACREETGLPVAAEVTTAAAVADLSDAADVMLTRTDLVAGDLAAALAGAGLPVLLERGPGAGVDAWLAAAERLAPARVVLCETGAGGPVDLALVPALRGRSRWPVLVQPGDEGSEALALAAAAAGADGVVVEMDGHDHDRDAGRMSGLIADLGDVAGLHGRRLGGSRIRYVQTAW